MAVQTALTLNAVAYAPRGTQNGVSTWAKVSDTALGGSTSLVSQSLRGPLDTGDSRVRVVLRSPIVATEASACACPGQTIGQLDFDGTVKIPNMATGVQRADFRKRVKDYFASTEFANLIDNLEGVWG